MTLEDFILSEEVAPQKISKVFAGNGLIEQFKHQLLTGEKNIKIFYLRPESFSNRSGEVISYFSTHQIVVDRTGRIIERIPK
jgi:hypothetical protein